MNYTIVDEPHEQLEVRPENNEAIALVQKRRASVMNEWNTKIIILNRREALKVHHAISDIVLSPARIKERG